MENSAFGQSLPTSSNHKPLPVARDVVLRCWDMLVSPSQTNVVCCQWDGVGGRALTFNGHISSTNARDFNTWLCCQMYRPGARLVFQPTRMCLSVTSIGQRGHVGFSRYYWLRFLVGRWLDIVNGLDGEASSECL